MNLDKKDKTLLYNLDINARESYTKLAKKVQISQESVRYRINRLVKEGLIQKFFTVIDASKLGFAFYKVLLKLHNVNEKKQHDIINYLLTDNSVVWLVTFDGNYDIGFVIKAENILELNLILENLDKNFSTYIHKRIFSINILGEYLSRDYLINKQRTLVRTPSYTVESKKYDLDDIDIKLIQNLTEDGRKTAVDISKEIEVSPDTILQRKNRLEKSKVITKYNIVLNHNKINQIHYKVLIYLNEFFPEKLNKFLSFCRLNNRIVYIIKTLGEWNYELDIEVENIDQYRKIMMDLTNEFFDIIKDYNSLIIRKIFKYNLYPR